MASSGKKLNTFAQEEHDDVEYRKRVASYVDGTTVSYEDANFTTGDSPVVADVFVDLGRIGHEGYIANDGPGRLQIEIASEGNIYGGAHTLKGTEILDLANSRIKKIRLTWLENTAYRVLVA